MAALAENSGATKLDIENDIPGGRFLVNILSKTESDACNEQRRFEEAYEKQFGQKPSYLPGYPQTSIDVSRSKKPESYGEKMLEDYDVSTKLLPNPTVHHIHQRFQYPRPEEMTIGEVYELAEHDDTFRLPEDLLR